MISIIMPVKNGLPYLRECIESIIRQSFTNWECIIIDDHSIDETWGILLQYSKQDKRIKPFKNKHHGIISALQTAYAQSIGTYITRMDADDIMPIDKLKSLQKPLKNNAKAVTTAHVKYFAEDGIKDGYKKYELWLNRLCDEDIHFEEIYRECVIPSPCWMMRKEDFDAIGHFDTGDYPEDYDLAFRMYANNIKVIPISTVLHLWRDHQSRASRNDANYSDNRFLDIKIKYFITEEVHKDTIVNVIGAGKKGKEIVKKLLEKHIHPLWFTDNPKKRISPIYGIQLESIDNISNDDNTHQVFIIAIAGVDDQEEIKKRLYSKGVDKSSIYFFC